MRLTCPNCDAQYEIPAAAIPAEGRDVQCSNCGHIWFIDRENRGEPATPPKQTPRPVPQPSAEMRRDPPQKELREDVKNVLQQEAARELSARQAEANESFVVQEEMGLSTTIDEKELSPPDDVPDEIVEVDISGQSSRDKLPPIEDVDATVDREVVLPAREPKSEPALNARFVEEKPKSRWGFYIGFWTAIVLLIVAVLAYLYAEDIKTSIPQFTEFLDLYVGWVDGVRAWLTDIAAKADTWINSTFNSAETPDDGA